jgi:hypothetical protein
MPNWCYNSLCVSGNEEKLADFVSKTIIPSDMSSETDYNEEHKFTFNILHPLPKALEGTTSPLRKLEGETEEQYKERMAENVRLYGAEDWYRWQLDNWGTKWDATHTQVEQLDSSCLFVRFDTAWSPPTEWYLKIFKMYPELTFEVVVGEESQAYCGKMVATGGEIVFDESGDYLYQDEAGNEVEYNKVQGRWQYVDTQELIMDQDFWPVDINPYELN